MNYFYRQTSTNSQSAVFLEKQQSPRVVCPKPFTPGHALWHRFTTQFRATSGKTWENPDHMISDVVDDTDACLQMAQFSLSFSVVQANYIGEKTPSVSDLHTMMAARCFIAYEVIYYGHSGR